MPAAICCPTARCSNASWWGSTRFATERVRELCETVDFHGGRPWTLEVAVWDVVGRALDQPLWRLLGGRRERIPAYASAAHVVDPAERAERAVAMRDRGIGAIKLRLRSDDWRTDIENVARVREVVGAQMAMMVDANQGWRMAGDVRPRWDVGEAAQCARELEKLGVYWLEEPLATDDLDGYAALRRRTDLRLAAGEMVRQQHEARDLIVRGGVDVIQTDVVLSGGIGGCRRVAAVADLYRRTWSPHTWSNGYGLVANLHAALAFSTGEYLEVPFDPPEWSAAARDWLLAGTRSRSTPTAPSPHRPARAWVSSLTSTRSSGSGWHDRTDRRSPRPCCTRPASRCSSRRCCSTRPAPTRCGCGWPPPACAIPTCTWPRAIWAPGRWPIVLGHEGAGVIEAVGSRVTHLAVGDPVAFCFVPPCRGVPDLPGRPVPPLHHRRRQRVDGHAAGRHVAAALHRRPDGAALQLRVVLRPGGRDARGQRDPADLAAAAVAGGADGLRRGHRRRGGAQHRAGAGRRDGRRDRLRGRGATGDRRRAIGRSRAHRRRRPLTRQARARHPHGRHRRGRRVERRRGRSGARAGARRRRPRVRGRRPAGHHPPGVGHDPARRLGDRGGARAEGCRGLAPGARPAQREESEGLLLRIVERRRPSCPR